MKFHSQKQIGKSHVIDIFTSEDMENISLCISSISLQCSYMRGRVKFKDFSRIFKAMYQQIQGLNTENKGLEIIKI